MQNNFPPFTNQSYSYSVFTNNKINIHVDDHEVNIERKSIKQNPNINWKKSVSDKLLNRVLKCREERLDNLREKKLEILSSLKTEYSDIEYDVFLSDYFDYILTIIEKSQDELYTNGVSDIEILLHSENINLCPICHFPVFCINDEVYCFYKCFYYKLRPGVLNENFTIENLLDNFIRVYKKHIGCKSNLELLDIYLDELDFVCSKCFYNILNN